MIGQGVTEGRGLLWPGKDPQRPLRRWNTMDETWTMRSPLCKSVEREFHVEEAANAKALKWEYAGYLLEIAAEVWQTTGVWRLGHGGGIWIVFSAQWPSEPSGIISRE